MVVQGAVVEQLDVKLVAGPIDSGRGGRNANGKRALVAHRQLYEDMGKGFFRKRGKTNPRRKTEQSNKRQCNQLRREDGKQNQNAGKRPLQDQ